MLLAEALAARKDAATAIDGLRARLTAAVLRYEDQEAAAEDPNDVVATLERVLDRYESLTVRINRTNNDTRLTFQERELSVMEAIALRQRLVLEAKARRAAVEAVENATGSGRNNRGWLGSRRGKDDLREIPTINLRAERHTADGLSEAVRQLDMQIQQRNWTTELLE